MTTYTTCICGSDFEVGFMICCDECDTWMHGPCVSITKSFATGIDLYYCPRCRPQPELPSTFSSSQPRAKNNQTPLKRRGSCKANDIPEEQPKRPRGRPRKINDTGTATTTISSIPTTSTTTTTTTSNDPPKRRSRPRKAKVLDYDAITSPLSSLSPSSWLVSSPSSLSSSSTTTTTRFMAHKCNSLLTDMSEEILLQILAFVHCHKSIVRVGATCRRLWRIAHDPYLWKHVTLSHDTPLRRHWAHHLKPFLLLNHPCSLTLLGEIPPPVHIHALGLDAFTSLQTLRLADVQTYSVYVLVRSLPWLRVFEARRIRGASEIWDWRPFQHLNQLEELMLWRNEESSSVKTFSLSDGLSSSSGGLSGGGGRRHQHGADEIYPYELIQAATEALGTEPGSIATFMGMTNETFDLFVSDVEEHEDEDGEEDEDEDEEEDDDDTGSGVLTDMANQNSDTSGWNHLQGSLSSSSSSSSPTTQEREVLLPRLRKLALINIGSPTTHRGTDAVLRKLVGRVHSFIYGHHSFNILFPVLRTSYAQLRHLCLLEPSGPAWKHGTWQHHVQVFSGMVRLETFTLVNPNMSRKFMRPILDAVLALERLEQVHVVALEQDIENVDAVFKHVVTSKWHGHSGRRLKISLKEDHRHDMLRTPWKGWHKRGGGQFDEMEDGVSSSSGSSSRNSSSSHVDKDKGSLSSLEEIRSNEEWCSWAREQVKAMGHVVVGPSCPREGKGKGKDGSSSSSLSGGRSTLSVEIEMVSSWRAYDSGLSQVCMEAWQAH